MATRGGELGYDSLLIAVGAQPERVFPKVTHFRGLQDAEAMHGLVQDVEGGYTRRIAFVVPPGVTWPLPLYELALMMAGRADSLGLQVDLTLLTPEEQPLGIFGVGASEAVDDVLARAGIGLVLGTHVRAVENGVILASPGDRGLRADRIVSLPRLTGPRVAGLPTDDDGFIPVDEHGRVRETHEIFAAGDGTTFPVKQGGLAAQQADAAARAIAARAGARVTPQPFRPTLKGKLLTGTQARYLRQALSGGAGEAASQASEQALWWPPSKVAAPYLAPYLAERAG